MELVEGILWDSMSIGGYYDADDAKRHIRKTIYERWTLDWPYSPKKHVHLAFESDLNAVAGYLRDLAEPLFEMYERCYMDDETVDVLSCGDVHCDLKGLSKEEFFNTAYDFFVDELEDPKEDEIDQNVSLDSDQVGVDLLAKALTSAFCDMHYQDRQ